MKVTSAYLSISVIVRAVTLPLCPFRECITSPEMMLVIKVTPFFAPEARYRSSASASASTGLLWCLIVKTNFPQELIQKHRD